MDDLVKASIPLTADIDADDIVRALDSDEQLFMFIWQAVTHEKVGVELRQRLLKNLEDELTETGNYPRDED